MRPGQIQAPLSDRMQNGRLTVGGGYTWHIHLHLQSIPRSIQPSLHLMPRPPFFLPLQNLQGESWNGMDELYSMKLNQPKLMQPSIHVDEADVDVAR